MKIDELIKELKQVKEEHGNLEVKLRSKAGSKQTTVIAAKSEKYTDFDKKACYIKHILDKNWFEQQD